MKHFQNILIGVDLASEEELVGDALSPATEAAIENGLWLAKQSQARVSFFHALEVSGYANFANSDYADLKSAVMDECEDRLLPLVQRAKAENVEAEFTLAFGRSWVEVIRHVLMGEVDLVIIGTHQRDPVSNILFGSTGMKLLRKCPCPLWITKPQEQQKVDSILVADDLSPLSDLALELGASMAALHGAQLHVLHVLEMGLGRREWDSFQIRQQARTEATKKLKAQVAGIDVAGLPEPITTEIAVDSADAAILKYIQQNHIGLLVMGTIARGGVAGVVTGNTAERLLPRIPCSVLAVKPDDFECPINVD